MLALMAVYGFAKQPTVYSMMTRQSAPTAEVKSEAASDTRRIILPNGTTIAAKVADTPEAQQRGLAGVKQLEDSSGMLFVFANSGTYSMWMKGMEMPIDMLWLDDQGQVVHLAANVPAPASTSQTDLPTYSNDQPARYVLELPAGETERAGIKEGDKLVFS